MYRWRSRPGLEWKNRLVDGRAGRGGPFLRGGSGAKNVAAESVTAALSRGTPSAESGPTRRGARVRKTDGPRPTDTEQTDASLTRRGAGPIGTRVISGSRRRRL